MNLNKYGIFNIPVWECYKCKFLLNNKPSLYLSLSLPLIKPGHF